MNKQTEALKLALEALKKSRDRIVEQGGSGWKLHAQQCVNAITAIREALAEQPAQQEPEYKGWYCSHCQRGVDGSEVTYHEQHTACGRVITDDLPPKPQQEPVAKAPGMAVQALAGEIIEALLADEKDGGYDLTAGLFGSKFSALVRRWAAAEWNTSQQPASGLNPLWVATHPDGLTAPQQAQKAPKWQGVRFDSALHQQPAQQEPVAWLDGPHLVMRSDWRDRANYKGPWVDMGRAIPDSWVPALYTSPPASKPDFKAFKEWAEAAGYDTAYTYDTDRSRWLCLNSMTADLWKAWQAAHGIKGDA